MACNDWLVFRLKMVSPIYFNDGMETAKANGRRGDVVVEDLFTRSHRLERDETINYVKTTTARVPSGIEASWKMVCLSAPPTPALAL